MSNPSEPWNNSYQLSGLTETLLRTLYAGPMTDDQVARLCLDDVELLLDARERAEVETDLLGGATHLLALDLKPFADAVARWLDRRAQIQRGLDWVQVPPQLVDRSRRRAASVLGWAAEQGWIERGGSGVWEITPQGRVVIERGGLSMK